MCALQSNGNGRDFSQNGNSKTPSKKDTSTMKMPIGGELVSGSNVLTLNQRTEPYEQTEIVTGDPEQYNKIKQAVYDLLDAFNVNWDDPNYTETPDRVAKAYLEYWASGYARDAEDEITVFPNSSQSGDLVMVKDMQYYSLCSHHLAPFKGFGAIAYLPGENLLGLSKLGRILNIYARRFQLQERIGAQTADKLMELLMPQGVMVILYDTEHMCMSSRGVQLHESNTTTIATRGIFKDDADLRREVLSMLR